MRKCVGWILGFLAALAAVVYFLFTGKRSARLEKWQEQQEQSALRVAQERAAQATRRDKADGLHEELAKLKDRASRYRNLVIVAALVISIAATPVMAADPLQDLQEAISIAEQYEQLYLEAEASNDALQAEINRLNQIIEEQQKELETIRWRLAPWIGVFLTPDGPGIAAGISF